jgi:arylsulfatase
LLLLTVDTLRPDHLGCYTYPRTTSPAIDALAARGVTFNRAYTYWPKTRGSFASMFTSRYASQHGLNVRDRDLPEFNTTLAEVLNGEGYRTAAAVDNGNLDHTLGFAQGFDRYQEVWNRGGSEADRTEALTRFALDFLASPPAEAPFFLWIHYVNPHTPYEPPEDFLARFRGDGLVPRGPKLLPVVGYHGGVNRHVAVPGESHLGDYIDRYDAEIAFADAAIGRVLAGLAASPHQARTLVVLTSDHGESLGEHDYYFDHGYDLFDPSLRVPLIFSLPEVLSDGRRADAPVTTLDILPSVLDILQVSYPPGLEGRSVMSVIRGGEGKLHDRLVFQNDQHQLALFNGRFKIIATPLDESENCYELYDLAADPGERYDRLPTSRGAASRLLAELESFRTRTIAWQQDTTALRRGIPARQDDELTGKALESLRALGYVHAGAKRPAGLSCEEARRTRPSAPTQ